MNCNFWYFWVTNFRKWSPAYLNIHWDPRMMEKRIGWWEDCWRLHGYQCDFIWSAWHILKAMGQANSTVYSSLPNTANDFILSPLDDSDDEEEELFSSTNDQHDEDLFLTSRYLHRSLAPCTCTCTQSGNILHPHFSFVLVFFYLFYGYWGKAGYSERPTSPGAKKEALQMIDMIDAIVLMRGVSADKYLCVWKCKYKYQNGNKYNCKR